MRRDFIPDTPFHIHQLPGHFCYGTDSLALLRFSEARGVVCDFGAGTGFLAMGLAARQEVDQVFAVELQREALACLRRSVAENGLTGKVIPVDGDIVDFAREHADAAHAVVMNPPYFTGGLKPRESAMAMARHGDYVPWIRAAARVLRTKGSLELVHRAELAAGILAAMKGAGVEPKVLVPLGHNPHRPAKLILVRGVKGGREGIVIHPLRSTSQAAEGHEAKEDNPCSTSAPRP